MKKLMEIGLFLTLTAFLYINSSHAGDTTPLKPEPSLTQINLLDINQASAAQLANLKGIGKTKAQAIVDYRVQVGRFTSIEELTQVKGIGHKMVEQLRSQVTL